MVQCSADTVCTVCSLQCIADIIVCHVRSVCKQHFRTCFSNANSVCKSSCVQIDSTLSAVDPAHKPAAVQCAVPRVVPAVPTGRAQGHGHGRACRVRVRAGCGGRPGHVPCACGLRWPAGCVCCACAKKAQGTARGWHRGQLQAARGPCSALARPLRLVLSSIAKHSCRQSGCLSMVGIIKLQSCKTVMLQRRRGAEVQSCKALHSCKHLQIPSLPMHKTASKQQKNAAMQCRTRHRQLLKVATCPPASVIVSRQCRRLGQPRHFDGRPRADFGGQRQNFRRPTSEFRPPKSWRWPPKSATTISERQILMSSLASEAMRHVSRSICMCYMLHLPGRTSEIRSQPLFLAVSGGDRRSPSQTAIWRP